jgi:LruC domain-containing protein
LLPSSVSVSYESTITNASGATQNTGLAKYTPSLSQIEAGLPILGDSGYTISSQNVQLNQTYAPGHVSKIKIIFNTPVARSVIGSAPYNIYLHVISTNKNIFFPGKYFDAKGQDLFMDSKGFPWAIMVPGIWEWPLESKDIRNASVTGYPRFNAWATSKGVTDKDWYTTVTSGKVYPLPSLPSNLLAYLKAGDMNTNAFMAIALIAFGAFMGLVIRKKLSSV